MKSQTTVLQVDGLSWASSAAVVEHALGRRPGVLAVEANAVSQTANVTYDPMRNSFLVAVALSVPILLWSPIGREVLGFTLLAPFGLRHDVFSLILSLPVIFYSAWIFFDGAYRALRARTLDMMVLVAVGVGTGWLYSLASGSPSPVEERSSTRRPPS
jgi:cation transport ATPase